MTLQYVCSQRRMAEKFYLSFLDMLRINKLDSIRLATFIDIYIYFFFIWYYLNENFHMNSECSTF